MLSLFIAFKHNNSGKKLDEDQYELLNRISQAFYETRLRVKEIYKKITLEQKNSLDKSALRVYKTRIYNKSNNIEVIELINTELIILLK